MIGRLDIVGLGMLLGGHITPRARQAIADADVVFVSASDPMVELWVQSMHADVRSLQPLYVEGKSRHQTYREMVTTMLQEVRAGKRVCGAFYGHPGVFAQAPHEAVRQARSEGYAACMEAGISASDMLYADLGIDPGESGCQYYEATQLLLHDIAINPCACLIVWQAAIAGERSFARFHVEPEFRQLLAELLSSIYSPQHNIALYEAATLPIQSARIEWIPIADLASAAMDLRTTLVVPPVAKPRPRPGVAARIAELEAAVARSGHE